MFLKVDRKLTEKSRTVAAATCTMSLRRSAQLFFRASRTARFAEEAVPVNADKLILNFNLPHKSIMNGKEVSLHVETL